MASSRALVVSGVSQAISESAAAAVEHAAQVVHGAGGTVVYDPNYRRRLTSRDDALAAFVRVAPYVSVALPSHPVETRTLLGESRPAAAAAACRRLGAAAAVVTCGGDGVFVNDGDGAWWVPAAPAASVVDATGAGDALTGTIAARLAHGDTLEPAVRHGVVAAARSLAVRGGTGWTTQSTKAGLPRAADRHDLMTRPPTLDAVVARLLSITCLLMPNTLFRRPPQRSRSADVAVHSAAPGGNVGGDERAAAAGFSTRSRPPKTASRPPARADRVRRPGASDAVVLHADPQHALLDVPVPP